MMKKSQKIIAIIQVIALLISCFPFSNLEDISRDGQIDIEDVILVVKGVARTVETSESIKLSVKRAVSVISVAAGLKTIIKSSSDRRLSKRTSLNDLLFIVASNNVKFFCNKSLIMDEQILKYKSIEFPPILPPPQILS